MSTNDETVVVPIEKKKKKEKKASEDNNIIQMLKDAGVSTENLSNSHRFWETQVGPNTPY